MVISQIEEIQKLKSIEGNRQILAGKRKVKVNIDQSGTVLCFKETERWLYKPCLENHV